MKNEMHASYIPICSSYKKIGEITYLLDHRVGILKSINALLMKSLKGLSA